MNRFTFAVIIISLLAIGLLDNPGFSQRATYLPVQKYGENQLLKGDTAVFLLDGYKSGLIQWQQAEDGESWVDIPGQAADSLKIVPTHTTWYRAVIFDGTCDPCYSESFGIYLVEKEEVILETANNLFPDAMVQQIHDDMVEMEDAEDYDEILGELMDALLGLQDTVNQYDYMEELRDAIEKFRQDFYDAEKGSLDCGLLNLGLGYSKGLSIDASVSGNLAVVTGLGLTASGGGSIEAVYDFVNLTSQIYTVTYCGYGWSFNIGVAYAISAGLGFSGYSSYLIGIPYIAEPKMNLFEGATKASSYELSASLDLKLGLKAGIQKATAEKINYQCPSFFNMASNCYNVFNNYSTIPGGVKSVSYGFNVGVSVSLGLEFIAAITDKNIVNCHKGLEGSFVDYSIGRKGRKFSRRIAGYRMAANLLSPIPVHKDAFRAPISPTDILAAAAAVVYSIYDMQKCIDLRLPSLVTMQDIESVDEETGTYKLGGRIISDGGKPITKKGFVIYDRLEFPYEIIASFESEDEGYEFYVTRTGMKPNTTYIFAAFAENVFGREYANPAQFTTEPVIPKVITRLVADINHSSAVSGGFVIDDGGLPVMAKGVVWDTAENPTLQRNSGYTEDGQGNSPFESYLTGLLPGTTYYVRAYATNEVGTGYDHVSRFGFYTSPYFPQVISEIPESITHHSVILNGRIASTGGTPIITKGFVWCQGDGDPSLRDNVVYVDGSGSTFSILLEGLDPLTLYTFRAFASNNVGLAFGDRNSFLTNEVGYPPEADFIGNPTSGGIFLQVHFTDLSTNEPTRWLWNFGDNNTSTQRNPIHTYLAYGYRNVQLTATNKHGSNTLIKEDYIYVGSTPVAGFSGVPTSGAAPLAVSFTDQSTNNTISWLWDFGDGTSSTERNPSKTYSLEGTYNVSLTATNPIGSNTYTKNNYILVGNAPVATFTGAPTSGTAPLTVSFTDQSTSDPTSWSWNFGDGTTSSQQNPSKTYDDPGTYTVALTSTNSYGSNTNTKNSYITVSGTPPVANFSGSPTSGNAPLTVSFTDQSTNNPTQWLWSFGNNITSIQQHPSITYGSIGIYTIQLTATNALGSNAHSKTNYIIVKSGVGDETGVPCNDIPSVTDIDGNVYNTVRIGNQCWMRENLKTTKYRNGISIDYPHDDRNAWENNRTGAYAWYDNDIYNKHIYGALYNWYAADNDHGLCPVNWRVPDEADWSKLRVYLRDELGISTGMGVNAGGDALKSCRQVNSLFGNGCATDVHPRWGDTDNTHFGGNVVGFSGLPAGLRWYGGHYGYIGNTVRFWSSSAYSSLYSYIHSLTQYNGAFFHGYTDKEYGFSVRCVKDLD